PVRGVRYSVVAAVTSLVVTGVAVVRESRKSSIQGRAGTAGFPVRTSEVAVSACPTCRRSAGAVEVIAPVLPTKYSAPTVNERPVTTPVRRIVPVALLLIAEGAMPTSLAVVL